MDSNQGGRPSVIRMLALDHHEDQKQQHGGNAMVFNTGEEEDKKGLVECRPAQGEFDQGEPALDNLAQGKPAQEELAQVSVVQKATEAVEEGDNRKKEMGGEEAGNRSSGPVANWSPAEAGHGGRAQQQPQQEAAMPEGTRSLCAGAMMIVHHRPRFTRSQLHKLEIVFQGNPNPSLRARKDLARWLGVPEADVMDWFKTRKAIYRRNSRMSMFVVPAHSQNNDPW